MKKRLGVRDFKEIESWLRNEAIKIREAQPLAAVGLMQAACKDDTDIPAWSSRDPQDTKQGRGDPKALVGRTKKEPSTRAT